MKKLILQRPDNSKLSKEPKKLPPKRHSGKNMRDFTDKPEQRPRLSRRLKRTHRKKK